MRTLNAPITIRPAYADDELDLARLGALDSAEGLPSQPLLLAEVDGQLRAALSLDDGSSIADPFHPTAGILAVLRAHAAVTADQPMRRWQQRLRGARGWRTAPGRRARAAAPEGQAENLSGGFELDNALRPALRDAVGEPRRGDLLPTSALDQLAAQSPDVAE